MQVLSTLGTRKIITAGALTAALALSTAQAASPAPGQYEYSSGFSDRNPSQDIAEFDGSAFTLAESGSPVDGFSVTLDDGTNQVLTQNFGDATFSISGANPLQEQNTILVDSNMNGTADAGELVSTTLSGASFQFTDNDNSGAVILEGSFDSAGFVSHIDQNSGSISVSGLDIMPGAGFVFDNGNSVDSIAADGFQISLNSITGGVSVNNVSGSGIARDADLDSFAPANGSVSTSGDAEVVPEPASLALFGAGVGLIALGQRRRRRHN